MNGDKAINKYESFLVDLLELPMAHGVFEQHQLTHNECILEVPAIITCLLTIYTKLQQVYPKLINIPLCVDLCLNWLLNVYDRYVWVFHSDPQTTHKMYYNYIILFLFSCTVWQRFSPNKQIIIRHLIWCKILLNLITFIFVLGIEVGKFKFCLWRLDFFLFQKDNLGRSINVSILLFLS